MKTVVTQLSFYIWSPLMWLTLCYTSPVVLILKLQHPGKRQEYFTTKQFRHAREQLIALIICWLSFCVTQVGGSKHKYCKSGPVIARGDSIIAEEHFICNPGMCSVFDLHPKLCNLASLKWVNIYISTFIWKLHTDKMKHKHGVKGYLQNWSNDNHSVTFASVWSCYLQYVNNSLKVIVDRLWELFHTNCFMYDC